MTCGKLFWSINRNLMAEREPRSIQELQIRGVIAYITGRLLKKMQYNQFTYLLDSNLFWPLKAPINF